MGRKKDGDYGLVLTRLPDEQIVIGEDGPNQIVLTVIEVRGNKVRLAFKGNPEIPIHRREVYQEIQKRKAAEAIQNSNPKVN